MKDRTKENLNIVIKYSILFAVMVIGVYFFFLLEHKSFIQYGDGYRQGYFWTVELKHNLEALFSGEGFSRWTWFRGLGAETTLPTDPFNLIAALFPVGYIELGYTFAVLLRIYCSGLAFIAFLREVNIDAYKCIITALCYAFSGWIVSTGLIQANFIINTVLFPLLLLGIERIYKSKSPWIFIVTVAYYLIRNLVFAYMAAIMAVLYIFIRYFAYNDKFNAKEYAVKIGSFIGYGVIGILISMIVLIPSFLQLSGASTEAASANNALLYPASHYYGFINKLIAARVDGYGGYAYFGISAALMMMLPIGFRNFSIKKTSAVMTLICFVMLMFPFFNRMFNGFSYSTGRWVFMFLFFIIWCVAEVIDIEYLKEKKNIIIMAVTWCVMVMASFGLHLIGLIFLTEEMLVFIGMSLTAALAVLMTIIVKGEGERVKKLKIVIITGTILLAIVISYSFSFYGNIDVFLKKNAVNKQLEKSTQRVGNQIDDDGFYRIDQVDGICVHKLLSKPANETLWWQTKSIYTYDSKVPADYLRFNKLVGNNSGYTERVATFSNDNRMGLDLLLGVKYFLGNDINEEEPSSQYAGYGFNDSIIIDGVEVLQNKYDVGLGFIHKNHIKESEFEKLTRLEREQALLQAVVVSNDEAVNLDDKNEICAEDVRTEIKNISYEVVDTYDLDIKDGNIIAEDHDAYFTIKVKDVNKSQLILSFDNLIRKHETRAEGGAFEILCENEVLTKKAYNKLGNQGMTDIYDYDINMGYYDHYNGTIKVTLSEPGVYEFDKLYVSAMGVDLYDECAEQIVNNKYNVTEYSNKHVAGTVDSDNGGILYLSVLNNRNWDIYIDGQKAEKLKSANIAFTGVVIEAGEHDVELRYSNKDILIGTAVSIVGLLAMIVVCAYVWYNKRKRNKAL